MRKVSHSKLFSKIIVPINASSLEVQKYSAMIAKKFNSEITVIHITSTGIDEIAEKEKIGKETLDRIRSYLNQKYEKMLKKTVNQFKRQGIKVSSHLVEHIDPAEHIMETTREENADLILMGHREEKEGGSYILGSTTKKVYRHSTRSVLIVKNFRKPKKILVGFDSSEEAKKALKYAEKIATKFDSQIKILHVTPRPQLSKQELKKGDILQEFKKLGNEIINKAKVTYNPDKVEKEVKIGKPADVILEIADQENFDLITVGSRGLTTVKKYLMGSVSEKISEYAKIPVLVAKL